MANRRDIEVNFFSFWFSFEQVEHLMDNDYPSSVAMNALSTAEHDAQCLCDIAFPRI